VKGSPLEGGRLCKRSSPEGWTHNGGGSRFIAPGGGFYRRGAHKAMSFCGEGGGAVRLGWCCVVKGVQERGVWWLPYQSREGQERGNRAGLGAPHGEEEDGGPGDAHARALGGGGDNGVLPTEAGGGQDMGGAPGSSTGRRKKQCVGRAWWMADGPATLGRPIVNSNFSDLFK
jgi:hypothetical protein